MSKFVDINLEKIDAEDIEDIVVKLEKSFNIKYKDTAFKEAKTFGDICDIIEAHIYHVHQESCTRQQAFNKVRKAISNSLQIAERDISLESKLEDLFPRNKRRRKLKELRQHLKIKFDILRVKEWLVWILFLGTVLSFIAFFFDWKLAVIGLSFFLLFSRIATLFSNELDIRTVRQFVEKLTRDNYLAIRRNQGTINRNEIFKNTRYFQL
jgi:hypothetical protein